MSKSKKEVTTTPATAPARGIGFPDSYESLNVNDYLVAQFYEVKDVLNSVERAGMLKKSDKEITPKNVGGWQAVPAELSAGQSSEQVQMLAEINAARDNIYEKANDILNLSTIKVCFLDRSICWKSSDAGHISPFLNSFVVKAKFLGDNGGNRFNPNGCHYSCIGIGGLIEAIAVFGYSVLTNEPQGFLLTKRDGEDVIYELEEFCMISSVDNDPQYADFDEWEKMDGERVFFTCFNKSCGLIYVNTPKADVLSFDNFVVDDEATVAFASKEDYGKRFIKNKEMAANFMESIRESDRISYKSEKDNKS